MIIELYISELLYRYQCVIVPNFGAFVAETISAQINENNTFSPPKKVVTFNVVIKNNDGLLANYIASSEGISYELAIRKIETQVNNWISDIDSNKSISFPKIGTIITTGADKNWFFSPENSTNFLTSSFGFSQVVSPNITREVLKQEVEILEDKAPIIFTPERKKNNYAVLKYAAVFAILGTVGLFGYKQYYDQQVETQTLLVQKNVQEKVQQHLQQATFFIEAPSVAVELPVAEEKMSYHLIASAFRSEENAKRAMQLLTEQGYKAHILAQNKHGLFPVTYGSYRTIEEAEMQKLKLHNEGNKEAWLLIE